MKLSTKNWNPLTWCKNFCRQSRAYLVEYVVLLIATGGLLGITTSQFEDVIDNIDKSSSVLFPFGQSFNYTMSLGFLAALVVLIPVFIVLTKRTGGSEAVNPAIKQGGWRKAFLGIFVAGAILAALGYAIGFFYELGSYVLNRGLVAEKEVAVWKSLLKPAFATLVYGFTAWLFMRDYRGVGKKTSSLGRRIQHYGLLVIVLAVAAAFVCGPLKKQRAEYVDNVIVGDLRTIESKVYEYQSRKQKLPQELSELELDNSVKTRAKRFGYEYSKNADDSYQLCAVFLTKVERGNQFGPVYPAIDTGLGSSASDMSISPSIYPPIYEDPSFHDKGRDCFTYQTYGKPEIMPLDAGATSEITTDQFNSRLPF